MEACCATKFLVLLTLVCICTHKYFHGCLLPISVLRSSVAVSKDDALRGVFNEHFFDAHWQNSGWAWISDMCVSVTMCGSVDICSFPVTVVLANNSLHVDSDQASNEVW